MIKKTRTWACALLGGGMACVLLAASARADAPACLYLPALGQTIMHGAHLERVTTTDLHFDVVRPSQELIEQALQSRFVATETADIYWNWSSVADVTQEGCEALVESPGHKRLRITAFTPTSLTFSAVSPGESSVVDNHIEVFPNSGGLPRVVWTVRYRVSYSHQCTDGSVIPENATLTQVKEYVFSPGPGDQLPANATVSPAMLGWITQAFENHSPGVISLGDSTCNLAEIQREEAQQARELHSSSAGAPSAAPVPAPDGGQASAR